MPALIRSRRNDAQGFKCDYRDFRFPAAILRDLGVERVRLLSNNPGKASALAENGIEVVAQFACEVAPILYSFAYLRTKKEKMGHTLSSWQCEEGTPQTKAFAHAAPKATPNNYRVKAAWGKWYNSTRGGRRRL